MSFRIGFFVGLTLGALAVLLLPPQTGREMRRLLRERLRRRGT